MCLTLCDPIEYTVCSILQTRILEWDALFQGIFPTQESNPGLPHWRWILYQLHNEISRILECVAYSFSRGSAWPRNRTGFSCIAGRFFTNWAIMETHMILKKIFLCVFSLDILKNLFTSVSLLLSRTQGYCYHLSKFHIYGLWERGRGWEDLGEWH